MLVTDNDRVIRQLRVTGALEVIGADNVYRSSAFIGETTTTRLRRRHLLGRREPSRVGSRRCVRLLAGRRWSWESQRGGRRCGQCRTVPRQRGVWSGAAAFDDRRLDRPDADTTPEPTLDRGAGLDAARIDHRRRPSPTTPRRTRRSTTPSSVPAIPTATSTPRPRRSRSSGSSPWSAWRVGGWSADPIPTRRRCHRSPPAISSERDGTRRPPCDERSDRIPALRSSLEWCVSWRKAWDSNPRRPEGPQQFSRLSHSSALAAFRRSRLAANAGAGYEQMVPSSGATSVSRYSCTMSRTQSSPR